MRADSPRSPFARRWSGLIAAGLLAWLPACGTMPPAANPNNTAPVATAGADSRVGIGQQATLDSAGSHDADNDPISFLWTQLDGPPVLLSDVHAAKATFTGTVAGQYTFMLTVTDARGAANNDTVVVTLDPAIHVAWLAPRDGDTILGTVVNYRLRWSGMSTTSTPHWRLFLNTSTGVAVREYTLSPEAAGSDEWDANWTPGTGGAIAAGAYQLIIKDDLGGVTTKIGISMN